MEEKRLLGKTFGSNQAAILSNPFPNQGQQMIVGTYQTPPQGGNQMNAHQETGMLKKYNIYTVLIEDENAQTRGKEYEQEKEPKSKERVVIET